MEFLFLLRSFQIMKPKLLYCFETFSASQPHEIAKHHAATVWSFLFFQNPRGHGEADKGFSNTLANLSKTGLGLRKGISVVIDADGGGGGSGS